MSAASVDRWQHLAACASPTVDPEVFFNAEPGRFDIVDYDRYAEARAVCDKCAVTMDCLDYALTAAEPYGIWGGLTPDQRRVTERATKYNRSAAIIYAATIERPPPSDDRRRVRLWIEKVRRF